MTAQFTRDGIARTRDAQVVDANVARARLDKENWAKRTPVMVLGAWHVFTSAHCASGMAYSDQAAQVIAVNPEDWRCMAYDNRAQAHFLRSVIDGASGMRFVPMERDFAEATRRAADARGVVMAKDLLDQVSEESERLIVQASGLAAATALQQQVFLSRFAEVQRKLTEAEDKLSRARSLVDLAGDVISALGDDE